MFSGLEKGIPTPNICPKNLLCKNLSDYSHKQDKLKCGYYLYQNLVSNNKMTLGHKSLLNSCENKFSFTSDKPFKDNSLPSKDITENSKFFSDEETRNFYVNSKIFINQHFANKAYKIDSSDGKNENIDVENELNKIQQGTSLIDDKTINNEYQTSNMEHTSSNFNKMYKFDNINFLIIFIYFTFILNIYE